MSASRELQLSHYGVDEVGRDRSADWVDADFGLTYQYPRTTQKISQFTGTKPASALRSLYLTKIDS